MVAEWKREGGSVPFLFSHSCAPWRHICTYWRAKAAKIPVPGNVSSSFHMGVQSVVLEVWQSSNGSKRREKQRELRGPEWSGSSARPSLIPFVLSPTGIFSETCKFSTYLWRKKIMYIVAKWVVPRILWEGPSLSEWGSMMAVSQDLKVLLRTIGIAYPFL